jgi:hypothetical protein
MIKMNCLNLRSLYQINSAEVAAAIFHIIYNAIMYSCKHYNGVPPPRGMCVTINAENDVSYMEEFRFRFRLLQDVSVHKISFIESYLIVLYVAVLSDWIIFDFIFYNMRNNENYLICICIRNICIRIQNFFTNKNMIWLLLIHIRSFSYYSSISNITRRYPIQYYPILSE